MCTTVHKMLFESHLNYCNPIITKLSKVLFLNQKLNFVVVQLTLLQLKKLLNLEF